MASTAAVQTYRFVVAEDCFGKKMTFDCFMGIKDLTFLSQLTSDATLQGAFSSRFAAHVSFDATHCN